MTLSFLLQYYFSLYPIMALPLDLFTLNDCSMQDHKVLHLNLMYCSLFPHLEAFLAFKELKTLEFEAFQALLFTPH